MPQLASAKVLDQIAENLVAGATGADSRVYTSRFWPLQEADLPAIKVVAEDELIEPQGISLPIRLRHELIVAVDGYVKATDNADDAMHTLAYEVMVALFGTDAAATLEPLDSVAMRPIEIARSIDETGPAQMGRITVRLSIQYWTASNEPQNLAG